MNELFSERLKEARRRAGYKANGFAKVCGISASYLSELESGKRTNPANLLIEKFATECGVTVDWLLGRDQPETLCAELLDRPVKKLGKGSEKNESPANIDESNFGTGVSRSSEKGQSKGECRYPEGCDLAGELSSVRERLAGVEGDLAYMRTQLDTVVGLLGHALGDGIKTTRPRESARKAG